MFHCSLRSRGSRFWSRCLPLSLADEKRVCSFVRLGQRRAILARVEPAYFVVARGGENASALSMPIARSAR